MKLGNRVRLMPTDDSAPTLSPFPATEDSTYARQAPLRQAIGRTRSWLHAEQHADGYWVGELEGDTILESEYILLLAFLGEADTPIARKCAEHMLEQQLLQPSSRSSLFQTQLLAFFPRFVPTQSQDLCPGGDLDCWLHVDCSVDQGRSFCSEKVVHCGRRHQATQPT